MTDIEDKNKDSIDYKKDSDEKPDPNIKAPEFKKITEGVIKPKDEDFDDLLKKIIEDM